MLQCLPVLGIDLLSLLKVVLIISFSNGIYSNTVSTLLEILPIINTCNFLLTYELK